MIKKLAAVGELVELLERIDQKGQIDHTETRAQVGRCHRADRHALNRTHLQLVENFNFAPQHGKGFVIQVHLAVCAFPQFVTNGKTGIDTF